MNSVLGAGAQRMEITDQVSAVDQKVENVKKATPKYIRVILALLVASVSFATLWIVSIGPGGLATWFERSAAVLRNFS